MWRWIMLITNSSLVVPHNLIYKYKHALLNKSFKVFISKKKQHTNTKKQKNLKKKKYTNWKKLKNNVK